MATIETRPPKTEPPTKKYAARKTTTAAIRGTSNILMKHRNMILEMSRFESGKGLKMSTTFDETNDVETCSPIKAIKNNTTAKKAATLPTMVNSLGGPEEETVTVRGRKTMDPKTPMKRVVTSLLIKVLVCALLTSCFTSLLPLCGKPDPARREKID
jgi:hypothetical protein